jgi:hypothetical protein
MGFWQKTKKRIGLGMGIAKTAVGMMSHMPGRTGELARMVQPTVSVASHVMKY